MVQIASPLTTRPAGRPDEVDRVRERVQNLRTAIGWDVFEVRSRVRETFDLRRQAARHPFVVAAIVLGGLFVAARIVRSLIPGARSPRR